MAKQVSFPNAVWFIPHPYRKSLNGVSFSPWNESGLHHRKLLESYTATIVDKSCIKKCNSHITFVGEWECCSEHRPNPQYNTNIKDIYQDIHSPFLTTLDSHTHVLNTDPFVFGDYFYYACCKKREAMKPGDIVIFGYSQRNFRYKLFVDTVMVLLGSYLIKNNEDKYFPLAYYNVTLSKILPHEKVWVGKMYDNTKNIEHIYNDLEDVYNKMYDENKKMFSFVPCKRVIEDSHNTPIMSSQPVITVQNNNGNKLLAASNGNHIVVSSPAEMKHIFDDIVSQVQNQGFDLGIYMPMPTYRELKDIVK